MGDPEIDVARDRFEAPIGCDAGAPEDRGAVAHSLGRPS